ncbi:endolytic peptidoglycan transglycosylase RlpA [Cellvibrio zantedeschiae]|uniref:Endolytic peptidoglycan transglycosylase RlpA n=1 Tax=Cellvibrio zantedeschiae TaxID=1237077 RepID=A0ABQ3ARK5_9GAMM|nr:septal ring lytic transglycosylase RlpA family protein [Cellvibrio zantedeschiae]GGY61744.1 endolytic peptidoglycan transglycosylase RlpA [Cellvibrio zantedeschiae]
MRKVRAKGKLNWAGLGFLLAMLALLNACSNTPKKTDSGGSSSSSSGGRYQGKDKDWGPDKEIDMSHIPDAVPRYESRTIAGNKNPYTVLGKTYYLMDDERAYTERGKASWYGYKFNGERTSNGELYDMFSMTGAHKTLPIPSYVRVTNLDNGKSVVVRINDRGPFHDGRIIDLSYAAAQRLGITRLGTGNVEVEIVVPDGDPRPPLRTRKTELTASAKEAGIVTKAEAGIASHDNKVPEGTYLQIAAFGVESSAKQFANSVRKALSYPVVISTAAAPNKLYRVRVGPFADAQSMQNARDQLQKIDILQSHVVYQ